MKKFVVRTWYSHEQIFLFMYLLSACELWQTTLLTKTKIQKSKNPKHYIGAIFRFKLCGKRTEGLKIFFVWGGGRGHRSTVRLVRVTFSRFCPSSPPSLAHLSTKVAKNLLNWTHPPKTFVVYLLVALVWLVLLAVPGRYIVLALGLYEFSKAWMGVEDTPAEDTPPLAIKLKNLLVRCGQNKRLRCQGFAHPRRSTK